MKLKMTASGVWCALWLFAAVQFAVIFQSRGQNAVNCYWKGRNYGVGATMEFACPFDYKLSTNNRRNCTKNGWQPLAMPVCKRLLENTVVGHYEYPRQCPSKWSNWGPCSETECGKEGVSVRLKGTMQDFVFPGSQTIFVQCNLVSDMAACTEPCATQPTGPHPRLGGEPDNSEQPTAATSAGSSVSTVGVNTAEEVTMVTSESNAEAAITAVSGSTQARVSAETGEELASGSNAGVGTAETAAVQTLASEEVTVNTPAGTITNQQEIETTVNNAETSTGPTTSKNSNRIQQRPTLISEQPSKPPATKQAPNSGEEGPNAGMVPVCTKPELVSPDEPFCEFYGQLFHQGSRLNYECPVGWNRIGRGMQKCRNSEGALKWTGKPPICVDEETGAQCPSEGLWGKCDKDCEDKPGLGIRRRLYYTYEAENVCNKTYRVYCKEREDTEPCQGNRFCLPRSCPPIPIRPNSNIVILKQGRNRSQFENGTAVFIECNDNYEADSFQHLVCENGYWSDPIPTCRLIKKRSCEHPDLPDGGRCNPTQELHPIGSVVTCTCTLDNHGNSGSAIRACREDQTWSGRPTTCVAGHTACPDPGIPENGERLGNSFQRGAYISFRCDAGYHIEGKATLSCSQNGSWSGIVPRCVYNFQPVETVVTQFKNRNCTSRDLCPCLPAKSCQSCHRERGFFYGLHDADRPCCGQCLGCCLELVFVFDESSSISVRNFQGSIRFAREVIATQVNGIERGCIRAAGIAFSHEARHLSTGLVDAEELLQLAESNDQHWLANGSSPRGGPTGIRCGLSEARALLKREARSSCRKIIFLITDGHANWCGSPRNIANKLKCHHCVEMFVVGIGSDINIYELSQLSSKPFKRHLFLLRQFRHLHQLGAAFQHRNVHL